jgi:hypothetical protein
MAIATLNLSVIVLNIASSGKLPWPCVLKRLLAVAAMNAILNITGKK